MHLRDLNLNNCSNVTCKFTFYTSETFQHQGILVTLLFNMMNVFADECSNGI